MVDYTKYPSAVSPEAHVIDWGKFYAEAARRSDAVAKGAHAETIRFGSDPAQRVELLLPRDPEISSGRVMLFLHGGGLAEGDPLLYRFVAEPYLRYGVSVAVAGYRLVGMSRLEIAVDDVVVAVRESLAVVGRKDDQPQLLMAGHSVGGSLAAFGSLAAVRAGVIGWDDLLGMVLVSGRYVPDSRAPKLPDFIAELRRAGGPQGATPIPVVIAASRREPARTGVPDSAFYEQSKALADALRKEPGFDVRQLDLVGDHGDTAVELARTDSELATMAVGLLTNT